MKFCNLYFTVINYGVKVNKIRLNFVKKYVYDATLNKPEPLRGGDGKPWSLKEIAGLAGKKAARFFAY
jgi:hypothetical protein